MVAYDIPTALIGAYIGGEVILAIDESIVGGIIFFLIPFRLLFSFMPKKSKQKGTFSPSKVGYNVGFATGMFHYWIL